MREFLVRLSQWLGIYQAMMKLDTKILLIQSPYSFHYFIKFSFIHQFIQFIQKFIIHFLHLLRRAAGPVTRDSLRFASALNSSLKPLFVVVITFISTIILCSSLKVIEKLNSPEGILHLSLL